MSVTAKPVSDRRYTVEEYFDLVDTLETKYEYHNGKLVDWRAMAGASDQHALITANIIRELGNALRGNPCRVYSSDVLLRIGKKSKYRFGDATVICGPAIYDPLDKSRSKAVINPKLVVEVLSESSEGIDRGEKFADYREIDSFEEYVLVSQRDARVETFRRQPDGTWLLAFHTGLDATVELHSLGVTLSLGEIFTGVIFVPAASNTQLSNLA